MLPCRREQCFVEVYATDFDVSVRVTNRREHDIALAGAVVGELCSQIGCEFLERVSLGIASRLVLLDVRTKHQVLTLKAVRIRLYLSVLKVPYQVVWTSLPLGFASRCSMAA